MARPRTARAILAASLVGASGLPVSVLAQEAAPGAAAPVQPQSQPQPQPPAPPPAEAPAQPPVQPPAQAPAPAQAEPPAPAPAPAPAQPAARPGATIRFNFKEAPLDQVIDFFARESGLPVIFETPCPAGGLTFVGAAPYTFDEALSILNLNLAMRGVHLRRQEQYLYLASLQDSMKKAGQVEGKEIPPGITPDQILTVTMPLNNAKAEVVAEQVKVLVGAFGGVVAVPQQNMLIVTETAAQCRRIRDIVQSIDAVRPVDSAFKLFPLKFAQADAVLGALKGLVGQRERITFVDKDGKQTTVDQQVVQGLNLAADARTNSIVAVGPASRIQTVQELVTLLDAPDGASGETQLMTFALQSLSAEKAAAQVSGLFAHLPANRRPVIIPLPEAGKVTVVGPVSLLTQAAALLGEIDPGSAAAAGGQARAAAPERRTAVLKLTYTTPQACEQLLGKLLSQRQQGVIRTAATPDGRGLIISGPDADVAAVELLVAGVDIAPRVDKEVRLVRIASGDPAVVLQRAVVLDQQTGQNAIDPVTATLEPESRTVTLVGSRAGIARLELALNSAQANLKVDLETRSFTTTKVRPSVIAPKLTRLAKPLLTPVDGTAYVEPVAEAVDELNRLIVRAQPAQMATLEELFKRLDADEPGGRELRIVRVPMTDAKPLLERTQKLYADRTAGMSEDQAGPVTAEYDEKSGSVLISARPAGMRIFTDLLNQAQQLLPPERVTRVIDVQNVKAADIVVPLTELLKSADPIDPSRRLPDPSIQVVERTNSLLVTAEDAQQKLIAELVLRLDKLQADLPPMKLLQLRAADAAGIAAMLNQQYGQRAQTERAAKPVEVRADAATNTLIVSAHPDLFEAIKSFVDDLNREKKDGPERVTQLFPLKVAKAVDVAAAMDKLYPQPPVPVDRQNRPMPWLQQPKEVTVSADASSNSLIIDAPAGRLESLQALAQQLDRVELPPIAELKTYRVVGADLKAIAQTLQSLNRQGNLSGPAQPGKPPVQVVIETEPKSSTLIVAGDEVTFQRVESVLKDLQAVPVEKGLRVVPVANVKAEEVKGRALEIYNAQVAQIPGAQPIEVSVDEKTNSLMVVAAQEDMQRFMKVMEELQRQTGPAREIRLIELKMAKAAEVVAFLGDMAKSSESMMIRGGPEPVFEPIESTNSILVAAEPSQFAVIEGLVKGLDSRQAADRPPMRILKIRTSDAANLAAVLQRSFDQRPVEQRSKQPVDIQADAATNTLIVSAHPDAMKEIEAIVAELNETQAADAQGREIRIFPLKIARAEELAQTIDQMYPEPPIPLDPRTRAPRPDLRQPREIVVRADRATNSLIVDAPAKRLAGFEQIVKSLDQQKLAANVELRTYRVRRANLDAVASTLRDLATSNALLSGPGGQAAALNAPITINTEPATRSLIVSGPTEVFAAVESVLQRLDGAPDGPGTGLKMYPLKHARAERLAPLMTKLLMTRLREQQDLDGKAVMDVQSLLDVAADSASNTLIISAPESIQRIAEELLKTLDAETAEIGRNVIRVIPLSYAEAGQVATTLNQALPTIELPSGGRPGITAAPGSNALLLSGAEADLKKVEELIRPLDVRPVGAETPAVETFALKHADAATIAKTVESLLVDQQETDPRILSLQLQYARQARQELFKKPAIRVQAETRTNCLIISAPAASLELAKSVIERLDQPSQTPDRTVLTFTPSRGDPAALAAAATRIGNATLPQGRVPVELAAEPKTGSIVILGTAEQVAGAVKILGELDERTPATPAVELQVLTLVNADAAAVAPTVQAMLTDRSRWPEELKHAEKAGLSVPQPAVNADRASNRLLVSVPTIMMPLAKQLVATLDQPVGQRAVDVRVFQLKKGQAASVATAMKTALTASAKPGDPSVNVTPEPGSNSVVVSGSAAAIEQSMELIRSMDEAVEPDGLGVRTVYLKFARAEAIAPVLETVLARESIIDKLPEWAKAQAYARGEQDRTPKVRVAAENRLNAVVVSGPKAVLEIAEQVITELDVDPAIKGRGADRPVRIITLKNADATELAASVQAVFDEDKSQDIAPTVRVDRSSNSLIVRASAAQMSTIEELTSKLDSATLSTSRQLRMVPVDKSRVDAELLARTLKRLLEQQGGVKVDVISTEELLRSQKGPTDKADDKTGDKTGDKPDGKPDGKPRSDAGDPRDPFRFRPAAGGVMFQIVEWRAGAAMAVLEPDDDEGGVTIAVDPASNSLLIVGSPRMTDRLAALAAELEKQMPREPVSVRVVTLPQAADAQQIAQLVQQTTQQIGRVSAINSGGFTGPVSVMADPAGAALIVLANPTDFETVGQLITAVTQVDKATPLTVKIYPLSSITAARARQAVTDLVSAAPQGRQARRVRALDVTIEGEGGAVAGRLDPATIRVTADPGGASLIVAAPPQAIALIDRFVALIDQSPVTDRLSIRRYALTNARADELSKTLQQLLDAQRQGPAAQELPQARFIADERTNSLLVTASDPQHGEIERILKTADASTEDKGLELAIISLQQATPTTVQRVVEQVVVGKDPARKDKVRISADDASSVFVVRASKEDIAQIRELVAQVDSAETTGLPLRSVKLERGDAQAVAAALQTFFKDRAAVSSRPGQKSSNRVAIVGDKRSGTLVIAASDEDFAQIESLVAMFDAPNSAQAMQFKIIPLKNARVADVEPTIRNLADQFQWERIQTQWSRRGQDEGPERVIVESNERSNSLVLMGQGDALATAERVIAALDQPASDRAQVGVRAIKVERADLQAVKAVIERAMATPGWRPWRGADPDSVTVELDKFRRALVLVGKAERIEQAAKYIVELDSGAAAGERKVESIVLQHARADRAAQSLRQFFVERARSQGLPDQPVSLIGSPDGNVLIASADEESMKVLKDLIAQIDQPELSPDRRIEVYALKNAVAADIASTLRSMFPRPSRSEEQVIITPQPSTNALVISAPGAMFDQVDALLKELDSAPDAEAANIATVALTKSRAQDVATALRAALPPNVKVTITPVVRSNTLLLTGSAEAIDLVMGQIQKIDTEPVRSLLVFRRFKLEDAAAEDVASTIDLMLRARPRSQGEPSPGVDYSRADNTLVVSAPGDQIEEIAAMVKELDVPAVVGRKTEFLKLQFASAEQTAKALEVFYGRYAPEAATPGARNVSIVSNPASNALVISADEKEWEGIRSLLSKLDTEEFDTSRQLAVIPLMHADAQSVARALTEGFRSPAEDQARAEQIRLDQLRARQNRNEQPSTRVLAREAGTTVTAEALTNSLVVFASREDLVRIESVVKQIDVPGFAKLPEPRVIPLKTGKASTIAQTIRDMFLGPAGPRGAAGQTTGPRAVVIIGDDTSGALVVRAAEQEFAQIKALADSLQQQGEAGRMTTHVLRLKNVPAARLRQTILTTFTPAAQQMGETIAVEIDRTSNSLVIACSPRLKEQIEKVVEELDAAAVGGPGDEELKGSGRLGQNIFIVDVQNNAPEDIKKILDQMGLNQPQPPDRPGVVSEPIVVVPLSTRRSVAILASPADGKAVTELIRAIDAEPTEADQKVAVVPLKLATAAPLVKTVQSMLTPGTQDSQTGPARALAEQIRRLGLARTGIDQSDLKVDLTRPIRLIADTETNSVIVASTPANVAALQEVIRVLDTLPIGDAVVIRMFPLENASSVRVKSVIDQLFSQGEALRRLPGTRRQGLPSTATGQALAGEIAVSVDERTNTLIVAGREEAVALVDVLVKDLDSSEVSKWIEPAIIQLKFADARVLADRLRETLVRGLSTTPEAIGLQKQYGRLRMMAAGKDISDPSAKIEADLFAPLTGLVINADDAGNSLIVVGTPANIAVVRELVGMLDIEAAAASNEVRVFPLKFAAADRVSTMIRDVFRQREQAGSLRTEDRLVITADARTNALVASTSVRSFAILDSLVKTLDAEQANPAVGLHVISVSNADVRQLAPKIEKLMRERIDAATRSGAVRNPADAFSIEAEPANSLLIVAASDENFQMVKELLDALNSDAARMSGAERAELITLSQTPAAEVAASLRDLYVDKENARRGANSVSVIANDRLNAIVVSGTDADVQAIRGLVARLDGAEVQAVREVKRIELRTANALELVNLLENVLAGRPISGRALGSRQATKLRFMRDEVAGQLEGRLGQQPKEADVDGAIRDQVTLTPDLRTNSIVIAAPPKMVELISELIVDLDTTSAGSRKIETFQLQNADARIMADLLRDVFNLRQQGNMYVLVPSRGPGPAAEDGTGEPAPESQGLSGTTVTAVPDERQQLSVAIDARTNTLIVSGTEEYLELVRRVVNEIDNIEANERQRIVYPLRNAKAKDIELTLQKYFRDESTTERQTLGAAQAGSLQKQLEEEVTVVGDEKSNKLVVSTSPRYMERVLKIIKELDSAPPQVMIQVLLAEVTLDADESWGMDFKVGPFGGDAYQIAHTATGPGVGTAIGVPNFSISSADFGLLIRALSAQGKLEVLSNPQVMVNNNQKASIQVGDNIALADGVERTPQGGTLSAVVRQDVGIILNVTPTISDEGFVRMEISPEISTLSARTTQITETFSAPVINKRTVDTTVTIKDGQSVVIGGLIQNVEEKRRTKVPILGDIPILGLPFQTSQMTNRKTELLVILTPRVVPGEGPAGIERAEALSRQLIERMEDPTKLKAYKRMLDDERKREAEPVPQPDQPGPWAPDETPVIEPATAPPRKP
ncbi:MAG: hypothetical protein IT436_05540 [Phycisphaerales bacterium]|nr:hypothetical protein [Phycisphaerales bacterium]